VTNQSPRKQNLAVARAGILRTVNAPRKDFRKEETVSQAGFSFEAGGRLQRAIVCYMMSGTLTRNISSYFIFIINFLLHFFSN